MIFHFLKLYKRRHVSSSKINKNDIFLRHYTHFDVYDKKRRFSGSTQLSTCRPGHCMNIHVKPSPQILAGEEEATTITMLLHALTTLCWFYTLHVSLRHRVNCNTNRVALVTRLFLHSQLGSHDSLVKQRQKTTGVRKQHVAKLHVALK